MTTNRDVFGSMDEEFNDTFNDLAVDSQAPRPRGEAFKDLCYLPETFTAPTIYEYLAAEGTPAQIAKLIPFVFGIVVTKYAVIAQEIGFLRKLQTPASDSMEISTGLPKKDKILNANKDIFWYEREKKFIAHSNEVVQKTFLAGLLVEVTALTIEHAVPKAILQVAGVGLSLKMATLFAMGTIIGLQASLVIYTTMQWSRALKKCSKEGLLRDKVYKLEKICKALEKIAQQEVPLKDNKRLLLRKAKIEQDIDALVMTMSIDASENTLAKIASILLPITKDGRYIQPPIEQLLNDKHKTEYQRHTHNMLVKQNKKVSLLSLQLAGWISFTAAAALLIAGTALPVLMPLALPIAAGFLAAGAIVHITASCLNKRNKLAEYKLKKSNFLHKLKHLPHPLIGSESDFIDKLKNHLDDRISKENKPNFSLDELMDASANTDICQLFKEHKTILPAQLRQGMATIVCTDQLRNMFKPNEPLRGMIEQLIECIENHYENGEVKNKINLMSLFKKPVPAMTNFQFLKAVEDRETTRNLMAILKPYEKILPSRLLAGIKEREKSIMIKKHENRVVWVAAARPGL